MQMDKDKISHQDMLKQVAPALVEWFRRAGRPLPWRDHPTPYAILVSETMLQQTRIETVLRYYPRFMAQFPDLESLAAAEEQSVLKLWEGLGYYSRARNLKKAAEQCVAEYGGRLPETAVALKKLPGVGDYTAGAVASLAFGEPAPAVDGNVLRVLARFFADQRDVMEGAVKKEYRQQLEGLLSELSEPGLFNEAMMELGELICLPGGRPLCSRCPWQESCRAFAAGLERDLPVRGGGRPRRIEKKTVLLLRREEGATGELALEKRPDKGLLAGLYGLPMLEGALDMSDIRPYLESYGVRVLSGEKGPAARHIFTHLEWDMISWQICTDRPLPEYLYASREDVKGRYPLPAAFKYFVE